MLKKTFIRILVLGTIVFASFFVLISATRTEQPVNTDLIESDMSGENRYPQGEFILESFIGSVLFGIH
ncbi:MAG: hypothetical protein ACXWCG_03810 [Flavitalea sp.]